MTWQQLILLQTFFAALHALTFRAIARRYKTLADASVVNSIAFGALYAVGLLWVFISGEQVVIDRNLGAYMLLAGGLFAFYNVLSHKIYTKLDAAFGSIAIMMIAIFAALFAFVFLGETLSSAQIIGGLVLLSSIFIANYIGAEDRKIATDRWRSAAYIASACVVYGIAITTEKFLVTKVNFSTYIVFGWGVQLIIAVLLGALIPKLSNKKIQIRKYLKGAVLLGVIRALAGFAFIGAQIAGGKVGVLAAVSNFRVVIITILAAVVLRERNRIKEKLLLSIISLLAIIIMLE